MRQQLQSEGERKRQVRERVAMGIRQRHDAVMRDRFDPLGDDGWMDGARYEESLAIAEMRLQFKERSEAWGPTVKKRLDVGGSLALQA